uniref:Uncharacterized protein n=1 Tax=Candidatus Methanophagaceae archaeon ANME-1 ERB6 TaxID=2759912 RepID=A0A7G9YS97_9EURY|nr:hypothetical protein CGMOHENL_00024 [Methanosarcinales archaeon ANME-1 ERB6]
MLNITIKKEVRNLNKEEEKKTEEKEEKLKEEIELGIESVELKQKRYALWFFAFIIVGITAIGAVMLFSIKTTELNAIIATANITNTENITTAYIKAYENIQIAKKGFLMILLLTLGILGFVGINYLAHPTGWSTRMIDRGRTVEYITVILIIGAILTLGLLETIGKETIGTILGAIAGYVLGKAVAPKEETTAPKGEAAAPKGE